MTNLPLSLRLTRGKWGVVDALGWPEASDYASVSEAADAQRGLTRFYDAHPDYLDPYLEDVPMAATLRVTRGEAVAMFTGLGLKTAANWNKARMTKYITDLPTAFKPDAVLPDPAMQVTFDAIQSAAANNTPIELVDDGAATDAGVVTAAAAPVAAAVDAVAVDVEAAINDAPAKTAAEKEAAKADAKAAKEAEKAAAKAAKAKAFADAAAAKEAEKAAAKAAKEAEKAAKDKAKADAKAAKEAEKAAAKAAKAAAGGTDDATDKPAKPAKVGGGNRDAFGSRVGTMAAKINALLTHAPQKMAELMRAAGTEETFYNHLNKLVGQGKVIKSTEGFALPPGVAVPVPAAEDVAPVPSGDLPVPDVAPAPAAADAVPDVATAVDAPADVAPVVENVEVAG